MCSPYEKCRITWIMFIIAVDYGNSIFPGLDQQFTNVRNYCLGSLGFQFTINKIIKHIGYQYNKPWWCFILCQFVTTSTSHILEPYYKLMLSDNYLFQFIAYNYWTNLQL